MKTAYFSLVLFLVFTVTFSQTKPAVFKFKDSLPTTLFTIKKSDTIKFYSLKMLAKRAVQNSYSRKVNNPLPDNYDWDKDKRRAEDLKNMALNIRTQDFCGRDLLIDIHTDLIQNIYFRSFYD